MAGGDARHSWQGAGRLTAWQAADGGAHWRRQEQKNKKMAGTGIRQTGYTASSLLKEELSRKHWRPELSDGGLL